MTPDQSAIHHTQRPGIALQLYTLRAALALDWRATLAEVAAIGYSGVETAGFSYASLPAVKGYLDDLGLTVVAAHSPLPLGDNQNEVLDTMAALGCHRLICAGTGHDQFGAADSVRRRAALFNEANAAAKARGLQFGLHNHWWEFARVGDRLAFDLLLDEMDDDIFLEIDTYWVETAGVSAPDLLRRLGGRAPLLHIKDGPCQLGEPMVAVGDGRMDFGPILAAGAPHAEWLIAELDQCATDMMTAVRRSFAFLHSYLSAR